MADWTIGGAGAPCAIIDWVKKTDSKFAEALAELCLDEMIGKSLMSRPGARQTFLMPPADVRAQYIKAAAGDEDLDSLWHERFRAFVIPLALPDAEAFAAAARSGGIGNMRGTALDVAHADGGVSLNGVKITRATDFKPRGGFAVWVVQGKADGLLKEPGAAKWSAKAASRAARSRGTAATEHKQGGSDANERATVREGAAMLRAKFLEGLAAGVLGSKRMVVSVLDAYTSDPYMSFCLCLFAELKSTGQLDAVRRRGLLDYSPLITFELIARPGFDSGEFDSAVAAAFTKFRAGAGAGAGAATVADFVAAVGEGGVGLDAYLAERDAVDGSDCGRFVDVKRAYGDSAEALWADTVREAYGNYLYDLFHSVFGPSEVVELPFAAVPRNTSYEAFARAVFVGNGLFRGDEAAAVRRFAASSDFKHGRLNAAGAREAMSKLAAGDRGFVDGLVQDAGEWQRDLFTLHLLAALEPRCAARAATAVRGAAETLRKALRSERAAVGGSAYLGGAASVFGGVEELIAGLMKDGGC